MSGKNPFDDVFAEFGAKKLDADFEDSKPRKYEPVQYQKSDYASILKEPPDSEVLNRVTQSANEYFQKHKADEIEHLIDFLGKFLTIALEKDAREETKILLTSLLSEESRNLSRVRINKELENFEITSDQIIKFCKIFERGLRFSESHGHWDKMENPLKTRFLNRFSCGVNPTAPDLGVGFGTMIRSVLLNKLNQSYVGRTGEIINGDEYAATIGVEEGRHLSQACCSTFKPLGDDEFVKKVRRYVEDTLSGKIREMTTDLEIPVEKEVTLFMREHWNDIVDLAKSPEIKK